METQTKYPNSIVVAFIASFAFIIGNIILSFRPIYIQQNAGFDGKPVNNISVSATGKVSVKPDVVTFVAGYTVRQPDISSVQSDLTQKNNEITSVLKQEGIADKDIQTTVFTIQPRFRYEQNSGRQIDDGHEGTVRIFVKVRNIEKAGKIIDRVVTAGANSVDSVQFTIDDTEKIKSKARELAGKEARKKADELARSSGVGLGGLIAISENAPIYTPVYAMKTMALSAESSQDSAPDISGGSLEVEVTVNATYAIR